MSLYIKIQNQTLLWNTIQKSEYMSRAFHTQESKQEWFRNIIAQFYAKNPSIVSNEGLIKTNQDTIQYMISDLKQRVKPRVTFATSTSTYTNEDLTPLRIKNVQRCKIESREETVDRSAEYSRNQPNRPDAMQNTFELRKQEYEAMYKKPDAPEVSFTEKIEDQTIKNMDELIKEQMKLRELDLPNYPIGPLSQTVITTDLDKNELNAIEIEIIDPSTTLSQNDQSNKLEEKVQSLEEKIKDLEKELREIRALFAKPPL